MSLHYLYPGRPMHISFHPHRTNIPHRGVDQSSLEQGRAEEAKRRSAHLRQRISPLRVEEEDGHSREGYTSSSQTFDQTGSETDSETDSTQVNVHQHDYSTSTGYGSQTMTIVAIVIVLVLIAGLALFLWYRHSKSKHTLHPQVVPPYPTQRRRWHRL